MREKTGRNQEGGRGAKKTIESRTGFLKKKKVRRVVRKLRPKKKGRKENYRRKETTMRDSVAQAELVSE